MDLMLALTEDGIHDVLWSQPLLAEWERVIVREHRRSAGSAAALTAAVREYFPEFEVPEAAFLHLVPEMPGEDQDDKFHMAAAIAGGADVIVTWNLADFPAKPLARWNVHVCDPDEYLCDLLHAWPDEVVKTVVRLAGEKRRPPLTPNDLADTLTKAGVPEFAGRLRARLADRRAGNRDDEIHVTSTYPPVRQ